MVLVATIRGPAALHQFSLRVQQRSIIDMVSPPGEPSTSISCPRGERPAHAAFVGLQGISKIFNHHVRSPGLRLDNTVWSKYNAVAADRSSSASCVLRDRGFPRCRRLWPIGTWWHMVGVANLGARRCRAMILCQRERTPSPDRWQTRCRLQYSSAPDFSRCGERTVTLERPMQQVRYWCLKTVLFSGRREA